MNKKNKLIVLISGIIGILVLVIGISYSVFNFNKSGTNQQLILGDIWMKYTESDTSIQIANATPQKLLASDFVDKGYLNPIMKEQSLMELNELDRCVFYLISEWGEEEEGDNINTGESYENFCRGTGTNWDLTFQEYLDYDEWYDYQLEFFEKNNIIISNEDSYILNPQMASQSLTELNELTICKIIFSDYELSNENSGNFCKGIGTLQGFTYKEHRNTNSELYLNTYNFLQEKSIIINENFLLDVDLPYFEFTISGKNTYEKEDIKYEIVLNNSEYNGIDKDIRNERILDKFLKFSLVEIVDNETFLRFHNRSYEELTNKTVFTETISNEDGDFNRTYRLYMWIGDEVIIGGGDSIYDYDMATWNEKIYASVRVDVNGDFVDKNISNEYVPATDIASFKRLVNNTFNDTVVVDTDGTVYLSGSNEDVNYNYVWYSGKLWRIVSINPDGTMKLITDNNISAIKWGKDDNYETSYIREWLNQEFLPTLYNYENIIVEDAKWNATLSEDETRRIDETKIIKDPVGLLNSYEYYLTYEKKIKDSYLITNGHWRLITPAGLRYDRLQVWVVDWEGNMLTYPASGNNFGVRPTIVLKSNIRFEKGEGTKNNPYWIEGDYKNIEENVTLLNERLSGEYVNFDNQLYRIMGYENSTTKLVKVNLLLNETGEVLEKAFSSAYRSNIYGGRDTMSEEYWAGYLNGTWYNSINYNYKKMLKKGIYYLGSVNYSYKESICKNVSSDISTKDCEKTDEIWEGYVGVPRFGEMFSTPTDKVNFGNTLILTRGNCGSGGISGDSGGENIFCGSTMLPQFAARPTITLSSEVYITSGDGTEQNPFEIAMRIPEDN